MKILIIDDSTERSKMINQFLKKKIKDCSCEIIENFSDACERLKQNKNYDIILLDMALPHDVEDNKSDTLSSYYGELVLEYMANLEYMYPVIVITAYLAFGSVETEKNSIENIRGEYEYRNPHYGEEDYYYENDLEYDNRELRGKIVPIEELHNILSEEYENYFGLLYCQLGTEKWKETLIKFIDEIRRS